MLLACWLLTQRLDGPVRSRAGQRKFTIAPDRAAAESGRISGRAIGIDPG